MPGPPAPQPTRAMDPGAPPPPLHTPAGIQHLAKAATVAALLAAVGLFWATWGGDDPGRGAVVAVLPFALEGDSGDSWLGTAATELVAAALEQSPGLHAVPAGPQPSPALSPTHVLEGSVTARGDSLALSARSRTADGASTSTVRVEGAGNELPHLTAELARRISSRLPVGGRRRERGDPRGYTAPSDALEAYFRGRDALRSGRLRQAGAILQRAVAADSTFALAHYHLALTGERLGRVDVVRTAASQAARHGAGLGEAHRLLVEALEAWAQGDAAGAEERLRRVTTAHPERVDGWWRLADFLHRTAAFRGRPAGEALEPVRRVLALDPQHEDARLLAGRLTLLPDAPPTPAPVDVAGLPPEEAARVLAVFTGDPRAALQAASALDTLSRSPPERARDEIIRAGLHLALGQRAAADSAFARAQAVDPDLALEHRALMLTLPFLRFGTSELITATDRLERWRPGGTRRVLQPGAGNRADARIRPLLQPYLLARVRLAMGDTVGVREAAAELEAYPANATQRPLAAALAAGVTAELLRAEGRPEAALEALVPHYDRLSYVLEGESIFFSLARERWLRASLLAEAGRDAEAIRWLEPFWGSPEALVFLAPSHFRRAQLREASGDTVGAMADYRRFLELWRDADPELEPWITEARARMEALSGG